MTVRVHRDHLSFYFEDIQSTSLSPKLGTCWNACLGNDCVVSLLRCGCLKLYHYGSLDDILTIQVILLLFFPFNFLAWYHYKTHDVHFLDSHLVSASSLCSIYEHVHCWLSTTPIFLLDKEVELNIATQENLTAKLPNCEFSTSEVLKH